MDFHALPRRDLQALCKRNGVRANMTNAAMADALAKLSMFDGIAEFVKQPVALPTPPIKSAVKAVADPEEDPREKKGSPLPHSYRVTVSSPEVIKLDDSDEEAPGENKGGPLPRGRRGTVRSSKLIRPDDGEEERKENENRDENAPALDEQRRGANRRRPGAPVVAPTTRRRAAPASKIETGDVAAYAPAPTTRLRALISTEAAPAPTTRRRAQSTVAAPAEEKMPQGRRTTRRAAARKPDIQQQQEEEEECFQDVVSVVESIEPAPISEAGCNDTDDVEETREPLAAEQNNASEEPVQEEEGIEVKVPAETVEAVAQKCSPDAAVEEKPVQEEEGIELEAPAETAEAVAQKCSPDAVVEDKQVDVEVEQPISPDDSPILGLVSRTAVGESEEAPVCNGECPMDMVIEESSDTVSEEKETMPSDEVPQATVACSEANGGAEFPTDFGDAKEEEDEMEAADEAGFAVEENGVVTLDELNGTLTEYADNAIQLNFSAEVSCADEEEGVVVTDDLLQSSVTVKTMVTGSEATDKAEFAVNVCHGSEEDALEAVNEACFAVKEKGVETVDEPHDTLSNGADSSIQLEEDALEAVNESGYAIEEKGVETVDEPHDTQTNALTGDLTLKFDGPGDFGDHNTSVLQEGDQTLPLSTEMPDNVIDPLSTVVTAAEEMVSEALCVLSHCMHGSSNKKRGTELTTAMEDGNEVKVVEKQEENPVELAKLSLRTLRAKFKEKLTAKHKRKEEKRVALARLDENVC